ncbi:MAG: DMT family transporter [Eggerthellaceae bacterium]
MTQDQKGYLLVFLGAAIWGLIGPFIVLMQDAGSTAELTGFLRIGFAFLITVPIAIKKYGISSFKINFRTFISCLVMGILCFGAYNIAYGYAVDYLGVAGSSVLLRVSPIFGFITAMIFFHEGATKLKVFAILVDIFGCALVVTNGDFTVLQGNAMGIIIGTLAAFFYSLCAAAGRIAGDDTNAYVISAYSYLIGAIFLAVALQPWATPITVNAQIVGIGFIYALVATVTPYILYLKGIQLISENSKVLVFASVESIVAAILGVALYHESLGVISVLGIVLVMASIGLMSVDPAELREKLGFNLLGQRKLAPVQSTRGQNR